MKIGVVMSNKKWDELAKRGIFDRRGPVEYTRDPGGVDGVLSKITDLVEIPEYWKQILQICPRESQYAFHDRFRLASLLGEAGITVPFTYRISLGTPTEEICELLKQFKKLIIKTEIACGHPKSHEMIVSSSPDSIHHFLRSHPDITDWIAQEFVPHGDSFLKIFIIGEKIYTFPRRSVPEDHEGELHSFNYKSPAICRKPCQTQVAELVEKCGRALGTQLFGIDVILRDGTGEFLVIDANYFPTYTELGNFGAELDQYILSIIE